jgi:hypothetical protein
MSLRSIRDRDMAQEVSRRPLTVETRVIARVRPCGICGGKVALGQVFLPRPSVLFCQYHSPWFFMLIYHEKSVRWWLHFKDIVSPNLHEQQDKENTSTALSQHNIKNNKNKCTYEFHLCSIENAESHGSERKRLWTYFKVISRKCCD